MMLKRLIVKKRMIVIAAGLASGLVTAIVALAWPSWGYAHTNLLLMPGWCSKEDGTESNWTSYVVGAIILGGAVTKLLVYGKAPKKRLVILLVIGAVWGCVSWLLGVLPILIGLWAVAATLYGIERFPHRQFRLVKNGNVRGDNEREASPLLDNMSMTTLAALFIGAMIGSGLKFGLAATVGFFGGATMLLGLVLFLLIGVPWWAGQLIPKDSKPATSVETVETGGPKDDSPDPLR